MRIISNKRFATLVLLFLTGLSCFALLSAYYKCAVRQSYLDQGIYEVGETFSYVEVYNSLYSIFMVCKPPADKDKLKLDVTNYIQEHDIIRNMKSRMPENFRGNSIDLLFVEPSSDFPVGWDSGAETGGFLGSRIIDHSILSVSIPWDASCSEEYFFYFH